MTVGSPRSRPFAQVDVFGSAGGRGNPVAVVLDADGLSGDVLQDFAAWTNLSETTFVLPPTEPGADYRVRIFTPSQELPFAGHPTLGTAHAVAEHRGHTGDCLVQQCGAGLVSVRRDGAGRRFAAPPLVRSGPVDEVDLARARQVLGLAPDEVVDAAWVDNGPGWLGVLVCDVEVLRRLCPTAATGDLGVAAKTGVAAQVDTDGCALEVRAFFDAHGGGPTEDPVTGSLNASLAQWLLATGRLSAPYTASQGSALGRAGRVRVTAGPDGQVWVGGDTVTLVRGSVEL